MSTPVEECFGCRNDKGRSELRSDIRNVDGTTQWTVETLERIWHACTFKAILNAACSPMTSSAISLVPTIAAAGTQKIAPKFCIRREAGALVLLQRGGERRG